MTKTALTVVQPSKVVVREQEFLAFGSAHWRVRRDQHGHSLDREDRHPDLPGHHRRARSLVLQEAGPSRYLHTTASG